MRRRVILVAIFIIAALLVNEPAMASNPIRKLGRGIANIATGWVELPSEIGRRTSEQGDLSGLFIAPFTGIWKALGRTLAGAYDVVTFPIPLPRGYEPLIEPEFVLQED